MVKKFFMILLTFLLVALTISGASAATIDLFEYAFNIDGAVSDPTLGDSVPAEADVSLFDDLTGLGTIAVTIGGAGAHSFDFFIDHEIDELVNGFTNEFGTANNLGALAPGQSWEIDEPGFVFGDIYDNFMAGALDNSNDVPAGLEDDVSMAMGWDFTLDPDYTAIFELILGEEVPDSGFYLAQTDPDSDHTIYFSGNMRLEGEGNIDESIPEPGVMLLVGTSLVGLACFGRKRFQLKQ